MPGQIIDPSPNQPESRIADPAKFKIVVSIAPGLLAGSPSTIEQIDCGGLDPLMAQHFLLTACVSLGMDSRNAMALMQQIHAQQGQGLRIQTPGPH